jgi:hypothetical protein
MVTDFAGQRDKALSFTHLLSHFLLLMLLSRSWYWLLAGLLSLPARAQMAAPVAAPLDVAAVDAVVARALKAFDVPGMAVAVVKDGQVVLAKGYGVRSLATQAPVDANTLWHWRHHQGLHRGGLGVARGRGQAALGRQGDEVPPGVLDAQPLRDG